MNKLTVLLVDDNEAFRASTAWLLTGMGFIVNEFESVDALLQQITLNGAADINGCVLTDLEMPGLNGLDLMEALRQRRIKLPVVAMTGYGDVAMAVDAMQRGAESVIEKPFSESVLFETLMNAVTNPGAGLRNPKATRKKIEKLSPREQQVLKLVFAGKLNKTIADILKISIKTVELHRSNMLSKLEVKNVQELVRLTLGYE
jgi:two-component system response regulator FixJ